MIHKFVQSSSIIIFAYINRKFDKKELLSYGIHGDCFKSDFHREIKSFEEPLKTRGHETAVFVQKFLLVDIQISEGNRS